MLALPGPLYCGDVTIEIKGRPIHISSHPEAAGTEGTIWDASVLLSTYLADLDLQNT